MIATDERQSQRLLNAGIDASTADMCICTAVNGRRYYAIHGEVPFWDYDAWSLSALWSLAIEKGRHLVFDTKHGSPDEIIAILVDALCEEE